MMMSLAKPTRMITEEINQSENWTTFNFNDHDAE